MANIRRREGTKRGADGRVRKTVTFQASVRRGGHKPRYKTFAKRADAEAWATALENAINRDEYVPSPESKRRIIRDMLERYRATEVPKKRDSKNVERYIDFWIEAFGDYKIGALTRAMIVETRDEMAADRSPSTVNRYLATLRHAFRIALTDWEWTTRNPCQKLALSEPRGRDRHLSDAEIKALLKATKANSHPHLHGVVLIALTTGARRGEITGLEWVDVHLKSGRAVLQETKNSDKRTLVLVPQVVKELKQILTVRRIDSGLVFQSPNPTGKRTYPRLEDAWQAALSKAEIEDFRFHDLRHTFASRMAMDGHSLAEIAAALGHRTLAMVQPYAHLTECHVQKAMESTAKNVLGDSA